MIKIQKDIPMPDTTAGRPGKYPFNEMEVGDSFELKGVPKNTVLNAANSWAKRNKKKYKFSIRFDNGNTRIWRTK